MTDATRITILLLRLALGWIFLYAGLSKLLDPAWTSAGFLGNAKTFPALFDWFASAGNLPWVDFLNQWGPLLIGIGLIVGFLTRLASSFGILLMLLYLLPQLHFPFVGQNSLLVDQHVTFILVLVLLIVAGAGRFWGLDGVAARRHGEKGWFRRMCS